MESLEADDRDQRRQNVFAASGEVNGNSVPKRTVSSGVGAQVHSGGRTKPTTGIVMRSRGPTAPARRPDRGTQRRTVCVRRFVRPRESDRETAKSPAGRRRMTLGGTSTTGSGPDARVPPRRVAHRRDGRRPRGRQRPSVIDEPVSEQCDEQDGGCQRDQRQVEVTTETQQPARIARVARTGSTRHTRARATRVPAPAWEHSGGRAQAPHCDSTVRQRFLSSDSPIVESHCPLSVGHNPAAAT